VTANLPSRIEELPTSLIDLAETIGLAATWKLIECFGGLEKKFPKNPAPDHEIILALGETHGPAVCHHLAGMFIYIPHARAGTDVRERVAALEAQNLSRGEIARELGISQRHVRRVANRTRRHRDIDPDQFDLFE